jgi:FlaA1/EpsC-like NDP-sugar epimerase
VTVTHSEVTRYFMTIPEASQLIQQASAIGAQQAVYTLDMGEPVPIRLLAEQMIRLAGKQPGKDVAIAFTGLRPGEKLHEALFHADERYRPTSHPKILQAEARGVDVEDLDQALARLRAAVAAYDVDALSMLLRQAVPEFIPVGDEAETQATTTVISFPARQARRT